MQDRTIRNDQEIIIRTRIEGYFYKVFYDEEFDKITIVPSDIDDETIKAHDYIYDKRIATETITPDRYEYTHGGSVYRAAQEVCWEIAEEFRKRRKAQK